MSISVKDIAWVAGILEGEGSFGLTNSNRSPAIWLSMTDVDIIERVRVLVDSSKIISIHEDKRKESYKTRYILTLNGTRAIGWMMTIYSLMGVRRRTRIRQILEIWKVIQLDKTQQRRASTRGKGSIIYKLRKMEAPVHVFKVANIMKRSGFTDEQIFNKLEASGVISRKIM